MQIVSPSFNPYPDDRWSDLKAAFRLVDVDAAETATVTAYNESDVSQAPQTHDGIESMSAAWATLETEGWPLDGSRKILPDDISGYQTGFWSNPSDEEGNFTVDTGLIYEWAAGQTSIGFTVCFDDKTNWYPKEFVISVYGAGDVLIDTQTVECHAARVVVEMPAENYRKVTLMFTKTQKPYQMVKVPETVFGIIQQFDRSNITGGSILYEISPIAEFLPSSEFEITIDNTDRKYNMVSPNSLYAYLQQGQPLYVEMGVGSTRNGLEYTAMGRFYYYKSKASDNSMAAQIVAYDRFMQLDKTICRIGTTGTWTVSAAVDAVIDDSGLPITAVIPAEIASRVINKCIPANATHREAFRLIAQAGMSTCFFNRADELVFMEIEEGDVVDTLDNGNLSEPAEIEDPGRINTVELTVSNEYAETENIYTASDIVSGETPQVKTIENPLAFDGNAIAAWLLSMLQSRIYYTLRERGNPAREVGDTVKAYDRYNENRNTVIVRQDYNYDRILSAESKGWR